MGSQGFSKTQVGRPVEIVFVSISPFTKRTKVTPKVFQEGKCCLEGLINLACGLQFQMLPRLNGCGIQYTQAHNVIL